VLIAIGGWNDSAGNKYSRLVNNPSARASFTQHVVEFIKTNNFDGLDLDWEYPKCWQVIIFDLWYDCLNFSVSSG
jgi:chitinase